MNVPVTPLPTPCHPEEAFFPGTTRQGRCAIEGSPPVGATRRCAASHHAFPPLVTLSEAKSLLPQVSHQLRHPNLMQPPVLPYVIARSRVAATKQSHRLWWRLLRQKPARSDIKVEETACFQHPVKRGLRAVLRDRQKPARSDKKNGGDCLLSAPRQARPSGGASRSPKTGSQ